MKVAPEVALRQSRHEKKGRVEDAEVMIAEAPKEDEHSHGRVPVYIG